jgi:hypothetical protein
MFKFFGAPKKDFSLDGPFCRVINLFINKIVGIGPKANGHLIKMGVKF